MKIKKIRPNYPYKIKLDFFVELNFKHKHCRGKQSGTYTETDEYFQDPDVKWSEGEIESFKSALRSHGKNWSAIAEGMTASAGEKATPVGPKGKHNSSSDKCKKSAEQCKSFFFTHRKQQQLDKILIERKRVRVCTSN